MRAALVIIMLAAPAHADRHCVPATLVGEPSLFLVAEHHFTSVLHRAAIDVVVHDCVDGFDESSLRLGVTVAWTDAKILDGGGGIEAELDHRASSRWTLGGRLGYEINGVDALLTFGVRLRHGELAAGFDGFANRSRYPGSPDHSGVMVGASYSGRAGLYIAAAEMLLTGAFVIGRELFPPKVNY
jgi:hypothetical protein